MTMIELVHDVLAMQLVDRARVKMGRVDGITIELRADEPPRVAELLIGGSVLADRVGSWAALVIGMAATLLGVKQRVARVPFEVVEEIGDVIAVDLDAHATDALRTEHWLDRIICAIPGAAGRKGPQK